MITYGQLRSVEPAAWRAAGLSWHAVAGPIARYATAIVETTTAVRADWSGVAARAADGRLLGLRAELIASQPAFIEIDQVLAEYAAGLTRARALLAADIRAALDLAATVDRAAAHRLADLAADAAVGWVARPPAGRPRADDEPIAVRRWWDGLTPAQRRWLIGHEAALIGRLDGLPVAARDQANRLLLAALREELLARRARLVAATSNPVTARTLARLTGTLTGLDTIADRLAEPGGPRAYLLALDPDGDGRAIVALGNPDRADNVLTYVPGMTAELARVGDELGRADRLATRCAELDPTAQTATVLWLDYDAPDFLHEAFRPSQAETAGPALHRFQEGLRASHDSHPAHQTVLGHSYGSLVVGVTARDHGLAADRVVFIGSPGVGVEHVAELNLPPGQVWASTAGNDVIQYGALSPGEALSRVITGGRALTGAPLTGAPLLLGRPADELWFGANPSSPSFGAEIFRSAPNGHSGYWNAGNPALDTMAHIALGLA